MAATASPLYTTTSFIFKSSSKDQKTRKLVAVRASSSASVEKGAGGEEKKNKGSSSVPNNSKYVVPLGKASSSGLTRPLAEILRDLNKRVPDNIINHQDNSIPWYHANRMLSFYAPGGHSRTVTNRPAVTFSSSLDPCSSQPLLSTILQEYMIQNCLQTANSRWCGEIRDVIYADNGSVTVLYRLTIRGSDGEAHRESTGTVSLNDIRFEDPVAAAEELAFCRACARFGFGLYLHHEDETV